MARRLPHTGRRVSLRRVLEDGAHGDLVGFVLAADDVLILRDRRGRVHELPWDRVVAWREVGVARGRDPVRAPLAELDRMAGGTTGRVFVARLSDLLDPRPAPLPMAVDAPPPCPALLDDEWVTSADCEDPIALSWWATHRDARSLQLRTDDPEVADRLLELGFTERSRD